MHGLVVDILIWRLSHFNKILITILIIVIILIIAMFSCWKFGVP